MPESILRGNVIHHIVMYVLPRPLAEAFDNTRIARRIPNDIVVKFVSNIVELDTAINSGNRAFYYIMVNIHIPSSRFDINCIAIAPAAVTPDRVAVNLPANRASGIIIITTTIHPLGIRILKQIMSKNNIRGSLTIN